MTEAIDFIKNVSSIDLLLIVWRENTENTRIMAISIDGIRIWLVDLYFVVVFGNDWAEI